MDLLQREVTIEFWVASIVGALSICSGLITCLLACCKCIKSSKSRRSRFQKRDVHHSQSAGLVSARLPYLISIEVVLMIWYLIGCNPLMLLFWYYLPSQYPAATQFNPRFGSGFLWEICGSVIFTVSFIPILTTHIIRLWLLKLKFNITSLSMLNQLGMVKWKDVRDTKWTKIYYNHRWTHNVKWLIFLSMLFDVVFTAIYTFVLYKNYNLRNHLNFSVFGLLIFIMLIGVWQVRSLSDPFNIFREEVHCVIFYVQNQWKLTLFFLCFTDHHSVRMGLLDVTVLHSVRGILEGISSIRVQRRWIYLLDCRIGNGWCRNDHFDSFLL